MAARNKINSTEIEEFRKRAESWCKSFPKHKADVLARRPIIVEVCGTPKAGKSTLTGNVAHLFRRCGLRTHVITERAEVNPLQEKIDPSFNAWNLTSVLGKLLQAVDSDHHVVLIDRGLLDCNVWLEWHHIRTFVSQEEFNIVSKFIHSTRWWNYMDLVIAVTVPPSVALEREPFGDSLSPVEDTESAEVPRVMEIEVLRQYNRALETIVESLEKPATGPQIWRLDLKNMPIDSAALTAGQKILSVAEGMVPEEILVLRRGDVPRDLFRPGFRTTDDAVKEFVNAVDSDSIPVLRPTVNERPLEYVQPIALGVIRHGDKVLLLRRNEADERSYMHEKYVICAGGHLRFADREERSQGSLMCGLQRELGEELKLAETQGARLIGLVYDTDRTQYLGHIGVVYEIPLADAEAAVARSDNKEFKERTGTSVSCTFVQPKELEKYYDKMDEWSKHIVSGHFGIRKDGPGKQTVLF